MGADGGCAAREGCEARGVRGLLLFDEGGLLLLYGCHCYLWSWGCMRGCMGGGGMHAELVLSGAVAATVVVTKVVHRVATQMTRLCLAACGGIVGILPWVKQDVSSIHAYPLVMYLRSDRIYPTRRLGGNGGSPADA